MCVRNPAHNLTLRAHDVSKRVVLQTSHYGIAAFNNILHNDYVINGAQPCLPRSVNTQKILDSLSSPHQNELSVDHENTLNKKYLKTRHTHQRTVGSHSIASVTTLKSSCVFHSKKLSIFSYKSTFWITLCITTSHITILPFKTNNPFSFTSPHTPPL